MMKTKNFRKKGVSPLVATVLLVGFTVVLVALIMIWGKNYLEEKAQKEATLAKTQIECQQVDFRINSAKAGANLILDIKNLKDARIDGFIFRIGDEVAETGAKKEDGLSSLEQKKDLQVLGISAVSGATLDIIPRLRAGKGHYVPCSEKMISVVVE
ncbi:hypothetical protein HY643_00730 [Candidatus Woesearchaeota archaeon]|nr:hypothetical protein [Candidatus Woesearchaeota archaeon]